MNLTKIPKSIRDGPCFCLMRLEQKPGQEKKTKVPYRANGIRADSTNPAYFTDLDTVRKVYEKGGYDGIGVGIFGDVIAIDIDNCVEDGRLNEFAKGIVDALDTYAEYSISGTGVHLWVKAPGFTYDKKRYYINNRKYGLEVYPAGVTNKFIVTTGNAINEKEVNECTDSFRTIVEKYMVRPSLEKKDEAIEL